MSLEKIDASYWPIDNKAWMEERKAQWSSIDRVLGLNRKKAEVSVIKNYFLKGNMPNWDKYREWDDVYRHLDLMLFLWLHPSDNPEVLKPLYKDYMESDLIHERDVTSGYGAFLEIEFMRATSPYESLREYPFPFMGSKNIILFRIMFEDVQYAKDRIYSLVSKKSNFDGISSHIFNFLGYGHVLRMWHWLLQNPRSLLSLNCMYQYEDVVDWCLFDLKEDDRFLKSIKSDINLKNYHKALFCFHHFDTKKEGETGRTRFVRKIRTILDEREFIPEFKQMWEGVKVGKIEVQDPWTR